MVNVRDIKSGKIRATREMFGADQKARTEFGRSAQLVNEKSDAPRAIPTIHAASYFRDAVLLLASALLLMGCGSQTPIARPADGYDAIRFRSTVVIDNPFWSMTFPAGSVFTKDRINGSYGPVYCGHGSVNGGRVLEICIGVEPPNILILGPGDPRGTRSYPQPNGSFEFTKQ
jgi:hypothetical protein